MSVSFAASYRVSCMNLLTASYAASSSAPSNVKGDLVPFLNCQSHHSEDCLAVHSLAALGDLNVRGKKPLLPLPVLLPDVRGIPSDLLLHT